MAQPTGAAVAQGPAMGPASLPLGRILIVDDHPFFADGLATILSQENLVNDVAQADSVAAGVRDLQAHPDTALVLLDLGLPGAGGMTLLAQLQELGLETPVVIVTASDDEVVIRSAYKAGAAGYMSKAAGRGTLVRMVRQVSSGRRFFPDLLLAETAPCYLTPRQQEVLRLLAAGLPNKAICRELALSDHTVKTHLKAIFSQLGVHNRTECVAQARALGLV